MKWATWLPETGTDSNMLQYPVWIAPALLRMMCYVKEEWYFTEH